MAVTASKYCLYVRKVKQPLRNFQIWLYKIIFISRYFNPSSCAMSNVDTVLKKKLSF